MTDHNGAAPMIEAAGLQKRYGDTQAVKGVDLQVRPGEIFGFLGPNGAGKTTTIKMLIGLLRPSAGVARIGGYDIQRDPIDAKRLIGYVPDQPYLPEKLTAREFLEFIAGLYQLEPEPLALELEERTAPAPGECPACAAQAEPGPWPDHIDGCPDAPELEERSS